MNYNAIIEGLLFVAGDDGLTLEQISKIIEIDKETVKNYLNNLKQIYKSDDRGITLNKFGELYKLTTKKEYKNYFSKLVESEGTNNLSQSCLETLAIIAYNQPITRIEIDELRGVNSSHLVRKLVAKGLIKDVGKSDLPGKPILYKTTDEFLDCFGLSNIDELPNLNEDINLDEEELDLFKTNKKLDDDLEIID